MHLVIEPADFGRLSSGTREELMRLLAGGDKAPAQQTRANGAPAGRARKGFRWREPHDLTPGLVKRLLRGIDEATEKRLRLFAGNDGRVSAKKLLAVTGEKDWKALSAFEGQITRRLRHLVGDDNRMVSFMMWDYDSETWDSRHETLIDGMYYVSPATTKALQAHFAGK